MKTSFAVRCIILSLTCSLSLASVRGADEPSQRPSEPAPEAKPSCCVVAKPAVAPCCAELKPDAPLPARSLYQLDATWTTDAGQNLHLSALRGRPVVMAMFFAQCEYACPILVQDIQRLRMALPETIREKTQVVLVTFDVVRDTPAALKAFRERVALDANWTLLHGDANAVQDLAMLLGVKYKQDARGQFAHSNLVTMLNLEGEVAHQLAGLNSDISIAAKIVRDLAK